MELKELEQETRLYNFTGSEIGRTQCAPWAGARDGASQLAAQRMLSR